MGISVFTGQGLTELSYAFARMVTEMDGEEQSGL
jgi:hypothetical protein